MSEKYTFTVKPSPSEIVDEVESLEVIEAIRDTLENGDSYLDLSNFFSDELINQCCYEEVESVEFKQSKPRNS